MNSLPRFWGRFKKRRDPDQGGGFGDEEREEKEFGPRGDSTDGDVGWERMRRSPIYENTNNVQCTLDDILRAKNRLRKTVSFVKEKEEEEEGGFVNRAMSISVSEDEDEEEDDEISFPWNRYSLLQSRFQHDPDLLLRHRRLPLPPYLAFQSLPRIKQQGTG